MFLFEHCCIDCILRKNLRRWLAQRIVAPRMRSDGAEIEATRMMNGSCNNHARRVCPVVSRSKIIMNGISYYLSILMYRTVEPSFCTSSSTTLSLSSRRGAVSPEPERACHTSGVVPQGSCREATESGASRSLVLPAIPYTFDD